MKPFKQSSAEHSKRNNKGMLLTTSAYQGSVWKPKWHDKLRLETHFRPIGPLTEDLKNFMPWRYSGEEDDFGPWIASVPLFTGGTYKVMTFIPAFEDPNSPGDALDTTIHPTPATEFLDNAKRIAYDDPSGRLKNMLLTGGQGRGPALPKRIAAVSLMQGILLRHGDRDYYQKPQMPCMLMMSPSATSALCTRLNEEVAGYAGDKDDYDHRFACGDVIGVDTGRILSFYNGLTKNPDVNEAVAGVNWDSAGARNTNKPKTQQELAHYVCDVLSALPLPRLADGRIKFAVEGELFVPWTKAIRYLDEQEMLETVCQAYQDLPGLLLQCLKTYHDKLPNYIKGNATVQALGHGPAAVDPKQAAADAVLASTTPAVGQATTGQPPAAAPAQAVSAPVDPAAPAVNWGNIGQPAGTEQHTGSETQDPRFADNIVPDSLYDDRVAATPAAGAEAPVAGQAQAAPASASDDEAAVRAAMAKLGALRGAPVTQ